MAQILRSPKNTVHFTGHASKPSGQRLIAIYKNRRGDLLRLQRHPEHAPGQQKAIPV